MGYLKSLGTSFIYFGAFLTVLTFIPGFPPDAKFLEYSIVPPRDLSDELSSNTKLNEAEILFRGEIEGPESFASYKDELYTGVQGGYVVKISDKLESVAKFGKDCDGIWQESKCGRPLGLKFDKKGYLYVNDAYYGIFKLDLTTGKYKKIVDSKEAIEGLYPKIINSLDIASNGDIYWTDSSTEFALNEGAYTTMANPSGRLIKYDATTKKNQVLIHNLAFANGVLLSEDESFVIVLETLASRIIKYHIKGPNAGKHELFIEGLPGAPDNVHSDNNNGFLVSIIFTAGSKFPLLYQSLMPHPHLRRLIARFNALVEMPFKYLQMYYPNPYAEKIIHYLGSFQSMMYIVQKSSAVLRINDKGQIIDAVYSDEKISGISSAYIHNEYLYLGSPFNNYLARIPLKTVFPDLQNENNVIYNQEKNMESVKSASENTKKNTEHAFKNSESEKNNMDGVKKTTEGVKKTVENEKKNSSNIKKTAENSNKKTESEKKNNKILKSNVDDTKRNADSVKKAVQNEKKDNESLKKNVETVEKTTQNAMENGENEKKDDKTPKKILESEKKSNHNSKNNANNEKIDSKSYKKYTDSAKNIESAKVIKEKNINSDKKTLDGKEKKIMMKKKKIINLRIVNL